MTLEDIPALEEKWNKARAIRDNLDTIREQLQLIDGHLSRNDIEHRRVSVKFQFYNGPQIVLSDVPVTTGTELLIKDFLLREEARYFNELEEL